MNSQNEMFHHYRCQSRPDLKNEVFIEGFPSDWTSDQLKNYLQSRNVGEILSVRVIPPKFDGRSSFAFVTFERNVENVILELNHHPTYFGGRQMTVSRAKSRARLKDRRYFYFLLFVRETRRRAAKSYLEPIEAVVRVPTAVFVNS